MPIDITEHSTEYIPHHCLVKLQAVYDMLKTAEKKAADLMLSKPEFLAQATIGEAAEQAGCSVATFVRLARRLGYSGYPELKSQLREKEEDSALQLYEGISPVDSYRDVVRKVFQTSIQALNDTLNVLNMEDYEKAVDAIAKSNRIVFCGVGDAANVAQSGYQKFIRAGIHVQASADPDVQLITASHLKKGDVLVAISHSGRTKSIVETVKFTRSTGATIIAITNYPVSPMAKNADIILMTAAFTEHIKGEIMSKRVAELCLIESLFVNVLLKRQEALSTNLQRSNRALEVNKI